MKTCFFAFHLFAIGLAPTPAHSAQTNPIEKVLEMLAGLQDKLIREGAETQKVYSKFAEWCEDRSQELHFEIKTGKSGSSSLKAVIEKATADITALEAKIADAASENADLQDELKEAASVRKSERAAFVNLEKDLLGTVDMLERAISIVNKNMKAGSFLQSSDQVGTQNLLMVLKKMVEASSVSSIDSSKLAALVQNQASTEGGDADGEDDDLDQLGAPDPAAYKSQSGSVLETLQGLLEKTESQLGKARSEEESSKHDYDMKKQSLEDALKVATKGMDEAKKKLAATSEKKAVATGDLTATTKDLKEDVIELDELHHTCMGKATDFQQETKARDDELGALAEAKKIVQEMTGKAAEQAYGLVDTSFLQVSSANRLDGAHALRVVRRLAYSQHSASMAQLASRIQSAMRFGSLDGESPFAKTKSMIMDMLSTLEKEAAEEATEKEYCDKEMAQTQEKLDDISDEAERLSTQKDQKEGASAKLQSEVATLQKELASLTKTQAEMNQLRQEEKAIFTKNKPELEEGLNGVQLGLKVLKDYYSKPSLLEVSSSAKGPNGVIALLEVAESDFSRLLTEMIADEEQAQAAYDATTTENERSKAIKEQDVAFKTKQFKYLDKAVAELSSDLSGVMDELSAVKDYDKQLKTRCVAKPESYEEKKKRREAEIAGLREALASLGGEAELLQERTLRGLQRHG